VGLILNVVDVLFHAINEGRGGIKTNDVDIVVFVRAGI
jgi:hypothetical protein